MTTHVIAVTGLAVLCGAWIAFQRWISRVDPAAPGIRRECGGCVGTCETDPAEECRHRLDNRTPEA